MSVAFGDFHPRVLLLAYPFCQSITLSRLVFLFVQMFSEVQDGLKDDVRLSLSYPFLVPEKHPFSYLFGHP